MFPVEQLRELNRENLHRIWRAAQDGQSLPPEERRMAEAMLAHPEYHNAWEFADVAGGVPYEVEGVNPYVHIAIHAMVEAQLEGGDPAEVGQALRRLTENGVDRHEAIHRIGIELLKGIQQVLSEGKVLDVQRYKKRLRRLAR